ncbi:MAG TPA: SprT family zinc-dependent metalloprotease [Verrucomicrobiae bacterium]|nr:SprT family zinc-dependent metalloprotease [Verrucomicrobiae bacterium]
MNSRSRDRQGNIENLSVDGRSVPLAVVHSRRASRYRLRAFPDGSVRLTVPRGGSIAEARRFAERNTAWIQRQLQFFASRPRRPNEWFIGTDILFRGNSVRLQPNGTERSIAVADETIFVDDSAADLRPEIENHFRKIAARELPSRVRDFAGLHGLAVRRVTVRNQRTRWGSCSPRGDISLNWRLIQTPPFVRDYIILHELMHLRQMNHSPRFWREVERVCPDYEVARQWLKQNSGFLRDD